jgi:hypothetical protein
MFSTSSGSCNQAVRNSPSPLPLPMHAGILTAYAQLSQVTVATVRRDFDSTLCVPVQSFQRIQHSSQMRAHEHGTHPRLNQAKDDLCRDTNATISTLARNRLGRGSQV